MTLRSLLVPSLLVAAAACAKSESTPAATSDSAAVASAPAMAPTGTPGVDIVSPTEGQTVTFPLTVTLQATGVEVIAASGTAEAGKGHHHLIIDGDAPSDTLPLAKPPVVIHMGNGASTYTIETLPSGTHRIITIFAGGDHVPMTSVRRDTVNIIVP